MGMCGEVFLHRKQDNGSILAWGEGCKDLFSCCLEVHAGQLKSAAADWAGFSLIILGIVLATFPFLRLWKKQTHQTVYIATRRKIRFLTTELLYLDQIVLCPVGVGCHCPDHLICESFLILHILQVTCLNKREKKFKGCLRSGLVKFSHTPPVSLLCLFNNWASVSFPLFSPIDKCSDLHIIQWNSIYF